MSPVPIICSHNASYQVELVLESKTTVSHDTFRFRFALQASPNNNFNFR